MDKKNLAINNSLLNETEGIITGYASVFNMVDQHNDLIQKGAFNSLNKQKIKLLWQHKTEEPIGVIEEIYEDEYGLYFRAKLLLELPQAREAYELLKAKAISGVSIGFKAQDYDYQGDVRVINNIDLETVARRIGDDIMFLKK
jgi:HK97 family phage prohead protease